MTKYFVFSFKTSESIILDHVNYLCFTIETHAGFFGEYYNFKISWQDMMSVFGQRMESIDLGINMSLHSNEHWCSKVFTVGKLGSSYLHIVFTN